MGSAVKRLLKSFEEEAGAPGRIRVFLAWLAIGLGGAVLISYGTPVAVWLIPVLALPITAGGWLLYRRLDSRKRLALMVSLVLVFWAVAIVLQFRMLARLGL